MICKGCGEEYASENFPVCPYCNRPNDENIEDIENTISIIDNIKENLDIDNKEQLTTNIEISIENIPCLSNKSKRVLLRNNVFTLSQLKVFSSNIDKSKLRYVGEGTINEIKQAAEYNQQATVSDLEDINNLTIKEIFSENRFNMFVEYCNKHNIFYFKELNTFNFDNLRDIKGIGTGKIRDIMHRYNQLVNNDLIYNTSYTISKKYIENTKKYFKDINIELLNVDIFLLKIFGINENNISNLKNNGFNEIGDLVNISQNKIDEVLGKYSANKFILLESELNKNLFEILKNVLNNSKDNKDYRIVLKKSNGQTLESIAKEEKGVTRERIRQIICKFNKKLDPVMIPVSEYLLKGNNYFTSQDLINIYDDDDFSRIILYWCKHTDHLKYIDFADVFIPQEEYNNDLIKDLSQFAEDLIGDGIKFTNHYDEIESFATEKNLPYLTPNAFYNFIINNGYNLYGDFLVKGRQSYGFLCSKIISREFPNGVKLDHDNLNIIRKLSLKEYGDIKLPDNDRAMKSRIEDFTVLCDRGYVTTEENINICGDMSLLDEIKEYIDESPELKIYYLDIYGKFESKLTMLSNINNHNFLHGVLKLYYYDEYDFSNRDYLTKRGNNLLSISLSDKLNSFILQNLRPVHKKEIKKSLHRISDIMLATATKGNSKILQWDYNLFYSIDLIVISDDIKKCLIDTINQIINDNYGYCSDNLLFEQVKKKQPDFINDNKIKTANNLFFLCSKLFNNIYEFRRPHIGIKSNNEALSVKNIALRLLNYPDVLYFSEYQKIALRFKWSHITSGMVFSNIEQDYIRISNDSYIKNDKFNISCESIAQIENVINKHMSYGFCSLINFEHWEEMPNINFEWNVFLLRSIVEKFISGNFKIIETKFSDRRYERGLIVDIDNKANDYEELVISLMKNIEKYELYENEMLNTLIINNLTYKLIPKELYKGVKLKYNNEKFYLT